MASQRQQKRRIPRFQSSAGDVMRLKSTPCDESPDLPAVPLVKHRGKGRQPQTCRWVPRQLPTHLVLSRPRAGNRVVQQDREGHPQHQYLHRLKLHFTDIHQRYHHPTPSLHQFLRMTSPEALLGPDHASVPGFPQRMRRLCAVYKLLRVHHLLGWCPRTRGRAFSVHSCRRSERQIFKLSASIIRYTTLGIVTYLLVLLSPGNVPVL